MMNMYNVPCCIVVWTCLIVCVHGASRIDGLMLNLIRMKRHTTTPGVCDAITCEHGHCEERSNTLVCICDKNYTGANCNLKCITNCGVVNTQSKPNAISDGKQAGFISVISNIRMGTLDILPNPFKTYGSSTECGFGFRCYNDAECDHSMSREGRLRFKCNCKSGYIGDFCEVRCDKQCKNGGFCLVERRLGKMLCGCPWPYSGPDCGSVRYPFWGHSSTTTHDHVHGPVGTHTQSP